MATKIKKEKTEYGKLPKGFKKKWIKALRSGKFKQGIGSLELVNSVGEIKNCCLGVACRLQHPRKKLPGGYIENIGKVNVPKILMGDSTNPLVDKLTKMNDGSCAEPKRDFNGIADFIEKEL